VVVDASVRQLLQMPSLGAPRKFGNPWLKGFRVWPVKGFDEFLIFYIVQMETLKVVRVLHGKRDLSTILKKERAEGDPVP
jgi:toxin ParE1/3/4